MALTELPDAERTAAEAFLLAIADDEFVHGERVRQWLTVAPTLEEDNVLTSLAQDELGHARLWYELVSDIGGESLDELAITREASDRLNSVLLERAHTDFADTVVRLHCYETAERLLLEALRDSDHQSIAERATVADREEAFHREHADRWLAVMAHAEAGEGRDRLQTAVREALRHSGDLFAFESPELLRASGVLPTAVDQLEDQWRAAVIPSLARLPLDQSADQLAPLVGESGSNGRQGRHTAGFSDFIASLQPTAEEQLEV